MECNQINVYDINLNRVGALYTWVSMYWNEGYNTLGSFQLEMQLSDEAVELIQKDRWCGIAASDTLMLIESVEIQNNSMIANGYPATVILTHRASDTVISNTNAETAMRSLVSDMEPWECVTLGDLAGLSDTFTPQTSDGTLEDYCETIGAECDIGFQFMRDGKELKFTCYKPERNPNAKYSTQYGNVSDIDYILSDAEYKNVAIVAGAGEGDERVTVMAGDTSSAGYERRETYIDARSEQPGEEETESEYRQRLVEYGEGKLVEQARVESVEFAVDDDSISLGDIVFVSIPEIGLKFEARIMEVTITSENNGTTREITVGTPFNISKI